ncbi:MAG: DNA primase [Candidatus Omnitrophica bacterium]|nr:DNA primase [Candidatus Omnitrophota bacterium]MBU4457960.1 DNA primase [Candidatus Omnitrophota bacterium]
MARIPEHILNEIQDRCDIVEVISSYIPLKQAGRNFKASCPFHHEKTPSFVVSPDKQIYHCFGCNSGGNVFNFIKEYEKIDFIDAVKMLAQKTGIKLPEYKEKTDEASSIVSSIHSINDIAANFYSGLLERSQGLSELRRYIEKRGLEEATIKKFRLGYADSSWRSFVDYLSKRGIKEDLSAKAGLILRGKDSSYYDLFRSRLIFPIFDVRGRVLGFGARVMDESLPKYINSPETIVYKKSQHLYGLNLAKACIREKGFAIVSEGYLDVITCHQYGINNAISSLGTALTVEQIRLLKRYTHNVVMVFDADEAGEMAALRGLDLFLQEGMNVKVATLEKGHDPDSFIRKFGPRGFNSEVKSAKGLFVYKLNILRNRLDFDEPESKAEIVREMLSTISKVRNAVIKAEYVRMLSHELSINEDAVWQELRKTKKNVNKYESRTTDDGRRTTIKISPAEKILVRLMLEDMAVVNIVRNNLKPFDFKNSEVRHLVEKLFGLDIEDNFIDATKLINYLEDKVSPNVISFILNDEVEIKDKGRNISDCIKAIKRQNRDERLKEIQSRLTMTQDKGYEDETRDLLEEFNRLIKTKELTHEKE